MQITYKGNVLTLRPIWQILLLAPLWPAYKAADAFVKFMDRHI